MASGPNPVSFPVPPGAPARFTIQARYARSKMPPAQWTTLRPALENATLVALDAVDKPVTTGAGPYLRDAGPDALLLTMEINMAPDRGDPQRVVLEFPTELQQLKLPFEFKDLVLP